MGVASGRWISSSGIDFRMVAYITGHEYERVNAGDEQAADDGPAERGILLAPFRQRQGHWDHADDHGKGGHDNGPQARRAGLDGGIRAR